METKEIINEIEKLPRSKKIWVIERAIHSLRVQEMKDRLLIALEELYNDYKNDKELTSFTTIDFDSFYVSR